MAIQTYDEEEELFDTGQDDGQRQEAQETALPSPESTAKGLVENGTVPDEDAGIAEDIARVTNDTVAQAEQEAQAIVSQDNAPTAGENVALPVENGVSSTPDIGASGEGEAKELPAASLYEWIRQHPEDYGDLLQTDWNRAKERYEEETSPEAAERRERARKARLALGALGEIGLTIGDIVAASQWGKVPIRKNSPMEAMENQQAETDAAEAKRENDLLAEMGKRRGDALTRARQDYDDALKAYQRERDADKAEREAKRAEAKEEREERRLKLSEANQQTKEAQQRTAQYNAETNRMRAENAKALQEAKASGNDKAAQAVLKRYEGKTVKVNIGGSESEADISSLMKHITEMTALSGTGKSGTQQANSILALLGYSSPAVDLSATGNEALKNLYTRLKESSGRVNGPQREVKQADLQNYFNALKDIYNFMGDNRPIVAKKGATQEDIEELRASVMQNVAQIQTIAAKAATEYNQKLQDELRAAGAGGEANASASMPEEDDLSYDFGGGDWQSSGSVDEFL